jgi:signal transduction histidine kinase
MIENRKQLRLQDQGLIPLSGRAKEPILANDVLLSTDYLPNTLLPETKSELALPMLIGDILIGVLDLQSDQANRFSEDDIQVLNTLAEQIAIAIRNAELYTDSQLAHQQAEQASQVKSQFLASVSHELRTPLNAILNFTQFVSTGMVGPVNNEQVDVLNKVVDSGKHLLNLINDVLDISKIESGEFNLFVEDDIDLRKEFGVVADTSRALLDGKDVAFEFTIQEDLPTIVADRRRVRQIMLNLVSNACKFTDTGKILVDIQREGEHVAIAVTDSGPGIAAEDFELIFETFRQTQTGLKQGEGTGLGLPISRRLAEAHEGNLWLESVVGKGSTFYVKLPIQSETLKAMVRQKSKVKSHAS